MAYYDNFEVAKAIYLGDESGMQRLDDLYRELLTNDLKNSVMMKPVLSKVAILTSLSAVPGALNNAELVGKAVGLFRPVLLMSRSRFEGLVNEVFEGHLVKLNMYSPWYTAAQHTGTEDVEDLSRWLEGLMRAAEGKRGLLDGSVGLTMGSTVELGLHAELGVKLTNVKLHAHKSEPITTVFHFLRREEILHKAKDDVLRSVVEATGGISDGAMRDLASSGNYLSVLERLYGMRIGMDPVLDSERGTVVMAEDAAQMLCNHYNQKAA